MSVNIVLPPLSAWAASRLTGLLQSKTQADFDTAFDATFAAECTITVNGDPLSRESYRTELLSQSAASFDESGAVVSIEGQTEVETGNQGQLAGLVGLFYTTLADSKFLVLGAPSESRTSSSLNLVIKPTEKNPQKPNQHFRGYFDPRRVVSVNQVVSESTYHVTIPASSVPKATTTANKPKVELGPGLLNLPPNFAGPFGGTFGPGPVRLPSGVRLPVGAGPVQLPPSETGAKPETLPGFGAFGVGPVIVPGETIGDAKQ